MKTARRGLGPNFLGIGAPRCGTTWLHRMLREHPQVWLPPVKEVHYFDSIDPTVGDFSLHLWSTRLRTQLPRRLGHYAVAGLGSSAGRWAERAKPDLSWDMRYFSPGRSLDWYRSLFDGVGSNRRRAGEITPSYFILDTNVIGEIKKETRIDRLILLLRDPIESAWSGYGRRIREGQNHSSPTDVDSVIEEMLGAAIRRRWYYRNITRWLDHFHRDQLFIGFFEDIVASPGSLLDDICDFLNLQPLSAKVQHRLSREVNSSRAHRGTMPPAFERAIARHLEPDLRQLAMMIGGPAIEWHRRAENALRGTAGE